MNGTDARRNFPVARPSSALAEAALDFPPPPAETYRPRTVGAIPIERDSLGRERARLFAAVYRIPGSPIPAT